MQIYLVGGIIRDRLLNVKSDDYDYVMVLGNTDMSVEEGFQIMDDYMVAEGYEIFLRTPEMFTIRAKFPTDHKNAGLVADFVLARKEVGYTPGTRRPILELGTLRDDLERRDFTVNAMAEDMDGNIIDLFNGRKHLTENILRTPLPPTKTMLDDPLRLLRAMRFSITKNMFIDPSIIDAVRLDNRILDKLTKVVSSERIQNEVMKMMKADTITTIQKLNLWDGLFGGQLLPIVFKDNYWLKMTNEKR